MAVLPDPFSIFPKGVWARDYIYILSHKYYSRLNFNYINFVSDQTVVLFEMDITLVKG